MSKNLVIGKIFWKSVENWKKWIYFLTRSPSSPEGHERQGSLLSPDRQIPERQGLSSSPERQVRWGSLQKDKEYLSKSKASWTVILSKMSTPDYKYIVSSTFLGQESKALLTFGNKDEDSSSLGNAIYSSDWFICNSFDFWLRPFKTNICTNFKTVYNVHAEGINKYVIWRPSFADNTPVAV